MPAHDEELLFALAALDLAVEQRDKIAAELLDQKQQDEAAAERLAAQLRHWLPSKYNHLGLVSAVYGIVEETRTYRRELGEARGAVMAAQHKMREAERERDEAYGRINALQVQICDEKIKTDLASRGAALANKTIAEQRLRLESIMRRALTWPCVCGCPITDHDGGRAARGICMTCAMGDREPCAGFRVAPLPFKIPPGAVWWGGPR